MRYEKESERKTEVCTWVLCRGWSLQGKRAKGGSSTPCQWVSKGDGHGCTWAPVEERRKGGLV